MSHFVVRKIGTKRSNRTFMELKYYRTSKILSNMASSNRTFMELKFLRQPASQGCKAVLIAPLWN